MSCWGFVVTVANLQTEGFLNETKHTRWSTRSTFSPENILPGAPDIVHQSELSEEESKDDFPGFFFHLFGDFLFFFSKVNPFFTKFLSFLCLILWPHFDEVNLPISSWKKVCRYKILESLHLIMSLFFSHMWWMLSPV